MSVIDAIAADILRPAVGQVVTLCELDLTGLGGSLVRFTPSGVVDETTAVTFDGDTFYPRHAEFEGIGVSGQGQLPRPRVRIGNLDGAIGDLCRAYRNCVGGIFNRRRTLKKYLDGQPGADPTAEFPVQSWEVAKKVLQDRLTVQFELQAHVDRQGRQIPGRVVLRDACGFVYRYYSGAAFVYPSVRNMETCPYTGANYFKHDGSATADPAEDDCGRRVSDCKLRYGDYGELPYLAFPGVGLTRNG